MPDPVFAHVPRQLVIFRVGETQYGLDIASVGEILAPLPITRIPGAPGGILGLVTARDRIVPLFDLHWKFGLLCDESAPSRLILVDHIDGPVALLVDSVDEVTVIAREAYQPVRTLGDPAAIGYIRGCVRRDDRLVLWVDHNQLVPNGAVSAAMRARSRVTDQVG